MIDLDWEDILYHNLGAIAIGLIAAFTQPWFLFANAIWFINEVMQRRDKGQQWWEVFTRRQVLWEWVSPSLSAPIIFAIASTIT